MSKTPAAWVAKIVTGMHAVAVGIESKRENDPFQKPEIYGHYLIEQYCEKNKIDNFFAPFSNLLSKLKSYVASHCEPFEQATYNPLIKKYEGFIDPKALGKPFDVFVKAHLDRQDVTLFTGLHMMMKAQSSLQEEIEQEDLEEAFETIKAFADQIPERRFRDAVKIDLDRLKAIMENARELGHYEFWDKYVQVSSLLADILIASSGSVEEPLLKKVGHYVRTARYVRLLAAGMPVVVGLLADATTFIDNVKKVT
jgi:hypothetical protein